MSDIFPSVYKAAIVKAFLKKPSIDQNDIKSYRPVSNRSFISKIFENIMSLQTSDYLNENDLFSHFQSLYWTKHSTETVC